MPDSDAIGELAASLVTGLCTAGKTVSVAESCTGGWIAKALTDVPGSSGCFGYGIVSYSNGAKESLLGVNPAVLQAHGAVSEPAVREMASGALNLSGADLAIAVSGVAGPGGGTDEKPVGTVWFAWACRIRGKREVDSELHHLSGDRHAIRSASVLRALRGLKDRLGRCV